MQYMVGIILFVAGSWILYSAFNQRKRVIQSREFYKTQHPDMQPVATHPSMQMMGDFLPPLIRFGLGTMGILFVILYMVMDKTQYFTLFDLVGVLFALTSYGVWITLTTSYREVEYVPVTVDK